MSRRTIVGVRAGYTGSRMACGPMPGDTVVEVKVQEDGKDPRYVSIFQCMEGNAFYASGRSIFDELMYDDGSDEEPDIEKMQKMSVTLDKYYVAGAIDQEFEDGADQQEDYPIYRLLQKIAWDMPDCGDWEEHEDYAQQKLQELEGKSF